MSPEVHHRDVDSEPDPDVDSEPVAGAPTGSGSGSGSTGAGAPTGTGSTDPGRTGTAPLIDAIVNDDTAALIDDGVSGIADAEGSLEAVRRERDEYLDMVRRVQADFENYKKRMQRQQTDQLERASENLVTKLLPALDALDLARAHLSDEENDLAGVKALFQATGLITDVLAKEGLERIDEAGAAFDPTVHDAVEHAPAEEDAESGVVTDVLRAGYRWKGRVIRPAMVRVRG